MVTKSHDDQQVNIQSLLPGRTYQFRVEANTNFGSGASSAPLEVSTQPEVNIAGPPRNFEGYARSHKEIYVKWEEPTVTNGEILKYRVYYSEVRYKTPNTINIKLTFRSILSCRTTVVPIYITIVLLWKQFLPSCVPTRIT